MPFVVIHDSNLANEADLAANIGQYAQQRQQQAAQDADRADQTRQLTAILGDERNREASQRVAQTAANAQVNAANIAAGRNATSTANTETRTDAAGVRTDKHIASNEGIAAGKLGLGYDSLGERTDNDATQHADRVNNETGRNNRADASAAAHVTAMEARLAVQAALQSQRLTQQEKIQVARMHMQALRRQQADLNSQMIGGGTAEQKAAYAETARAIQEINDAFANAPPPAPVPIPQLQQPNVLPPQNLAPQVQQQQATPTPVQQFAPPAGYDPQAIPADPQQATPAAPAPLAPQVVQTLRAITQEVKAAFPGATPQQLKELIKVRMTHAGIDPNALGIQ